jgi:hypothetical protein
MPRVDRYLTGDPATKRNTIQDNVRNQPHLAAAWLTRRLELFRVKIFNPRLGNDDIWFHSSHFVWQARESGYILWRLDAPNANMANERTWYLFVRFWLPYITPFNLDPDRTLNFLYP